MLKEVNKTIAVLVVLLMTTQSLVLWPPWEAWRSEAKLSLRAVASLPRAVGILPESTGESDPDEDVHRCRNPDSASGTREAFGRRRVTMGYRIRDRPFWRKRREVA